MRRLATSTVAACRFCACVKGLVHQPDGGDTLVAGRGGSHSGAVGDHSCLPRPTDHRRHRQPLGTQTQGRLDSVPPQHIRTLCSALHF